MKIVEGIVLLLGPCVVVMAQSTPKLLEMPIHTCDESGCVSESTKLTLDANWRWYYKTSNFQNCFDNGYKCNSDEDCSDCVITGLNDNDYNRYGITTDNGALTMSFADNPAGNIGARLYLMNAEGTEYRKIDHTKRLEQELSIDVEIGSLGCGLNGAIYYSEMLMDGGSSRDGNQGAPYGTGYCDAQCPKDLHHVDGRVNWREEAQCCNEMDIWEANSISNAFTPHTCTGFNPFTGENDETEPMVGPVKCVTDGECGIGDRYTESMCDKDGCDINQYRMGNADFYGPGKTVDSNKKFTMTTQFFTDDNGDLVEIKRQYYQEDSTGVLRKIESPPFLMNGQEFDSITDEMCIQQKEPAIGADAGGHGSESTFLRKGGNKEMGESFKRGMVLIFSVWDDGVTNMSWLDSTAESQGLPGLYGQSRGPCQNQPVDRGSAASKSAIVTYSNVRIGTIGSTSPLDSVATEPPTVPSSTQSPTIPSFTQSPTVGSVSTESPTQKPATLSPTVAQNPTCVNRWAACTDDHSSCCDGLTCHIQSQWYAQCLRTCPPGGNCVNGNSTPSPTTTIVTPNPTSSPTTGQTPTSSPTTGQKLTSSPTTGQTGFNSCDEMQTQPYSASVIYDTGDEVLFEGNIYSALWYAKGQTPTAGAPWEFVRTCDSTLLSICGGVPQWSSVATYRKGKQVYYENNIYTARWWSSAIPPPDTSSWSLVGNC